MSKTVSSHTSNVLDLTRALAAGLVVLFHARINALGGILPSDLGGGLAYAITDCGTQAVFWFFVISGYLVGGSALLDIKAGRFDFRHYLFNRTSRLYIVLLPALVLGYLLDSSRVAAVGLNAHAGFETAASLSATTFIGNVFFLQTIFVPTFGSNYPLWSLACEFWYYLLFPLLFAPLMSDRSRSVRLSLFLLGVVLLGIIAKENSSIVWLFLVWCLGVGVRVYSGPLLLSEPLSWVLAAAGVLSYPLLHPWIGPIATLLVATTFALAIAASHRTRVSEWRFANVVKLFGGFSYSLYLVHLPLQHYVLTMLRGDSDPFLWLAPESALAPAVICGLVALCYAAGFLFSLGTERNTQALRRFLLRPPFVVRGSG